MLADRHESIAAELAELADATAWIDTHEHLVEERHRIGARPYSFTPSGEDEVLHLPADWTVLIAQYALDDLVSAGLPASAARELLGTELGPLEKWLLIEPHVERVRSTGYWAAVDQTSERLFGLRLGRDTCAEIDAACRKLRQPGFYRHVLRDVANVDWCHVNSLDESPFCETAQPALLQQDLGLFPLVMGRPHPAEAASGIEVRELDDQLGVIDWCFERYGEAAVAVKCQWAYVRDLAVELVEPPSKQEFARLRRGEATAAERRVVEDFLFTRCVTLAAERGLPVKLHLGYMSGNHAPRLADLPLHVSQVTALVQRHPEATFVLMHSAWPHGEQLIALAKHCPNVIVDLSWAWILAPLATVEFVQRFLTSASASKLLAFGGDYLAVESVVGHAALARKGLVTALSTLVGERWISRKDALALMPMLMRENALRLFKVPADRSPRVSGGQSPHRPDVTTA